MKDTLIYSRQAYNLDKQFEKDVLETASIATSHDNHIELLQELYPDYTMEALYTYNHTNIIIEREKSCDWDSSADAFCAYKNESELVAKLIEINDQLDDRY